MIKSENAKTKLISRDRIFAQYQTKYFNLFLNRFRWKGDLDEQQVNFIMRQFWTAGQVGCIKLEGSEGSSEHPQGLLVFCPFAPTLFNIYNYPIYAQAIALRPVKFIPTRQLKVDEEIVLGYINRSRSPIKPVVDYYCEKLASIEAVIQVNLLVQKTPWIIKTAPESQRKMLELSDFLMQDKPRIFVDLDEADKAEALVSGAPYVIDKLYAYKNAVENELREYLGFNNLGLSEKKEHMIRDEVNMNNEATDASGDVYLDCLGDFAEKITNVHGVSVEVELNEPEQTVPEKDPSENIEREDIEE